MQYFPESTPGSEDDAISALLWRTWANFARTGKPLPDWRPLSTDKYADWLSGDFARLENGHPDWIIDHGLLASKERMQFWSQIDRETTSLF